MDDAPSTPPAPDVPPQGVRGAVALLAALGALLVGLVGGTALGGAVGYVAGQRAAGGDVVVPAFIERLGLVPTAPTADDDDAADGAAADARADDAADADGADDAADGDAADDAADADDTAADDTADRAKGGRQAGPLGARPVLGVEVATEPLAVGDRTSGAGVMRVAPDSAAAAAGFEVGDVIVAVDGDAVATSDALAAAIAARRPGERVMLTVLRGEAELSVEVTLGAARP